MKKIKRRKETEKVVREKYKDQEVEKEEEKADIREVSNEKTNLIKKFLPFIPSR